MNDRPQTTLFMLMSLDGKISTGADDHRDFDQDLPNIAGASAGLHQYYELERQTDAFSFNTGKVMAKVGWNGSKTDAKPIPASFIIVDNQPHLTSQGVVNLARLTQKLYLVTSNEEHPATKIHDDKLEIIQYHGQIDFRDLFQQLKSKSVDKLTIQSGGEMNAQLLRSGLVDQVSIVVTPLLIGGRSTPTLMDGQSLHSLQDLQKVRSLKLIEAVPLANSYLHLRYEVIN